MDFSLTVRAIARRWYVAVPVFLAVIGIAGIVAYLTPHKYESTGTVVLMEPNPNGALRDHSLGPDGIANPLLSFADSLTTSSQLLIQSLNSPTAQDAVQKAGGITTFTASDGALRGPYIVVTADAPTPGAVTRTVSLAFDYITNELLKREQVLGAPPEQYIEVKTVVAPTDATPLHGGKSRFTLTVGIIAISASLCAVYAAETIARRKRFQTARTGQVPATAGARS